MVMIPDQDNEADGDDEIMCFSTTFDNHVYGRLSIEMPRDHYHQVIPHHMLKHLVM